ncbi:MAG: hypothetical protein HC905_26405 [Bacteroidales bacterium]|nr:hypothetical protein [Bacteroidales bacterium]
MYQYLKTSAPKTTDGILHHVTYAKQIWSDASFMAPPFWPSWEIMTRQ